MNLEGLSKSYQEHNYYKFRASYINEMMETFSVELQKTERAFIQAIELGETSIIMLLPQDKDFLSLIALLRLLGFGVIIDKKNEFNNVTEVVDLSVNSRKHVRFVVSFLTKTDTKELNDIANSL